MEHIEQKQPFTLESLAREGVTIIKSPEVPEHMELDLSNIEPTNPSQQIQLRRSVASCVQVCAMFVAGSVITDTFANHYERRKWRHLMASKYGEPFSAVYETNKLRLNNLGGVQSWLETAVSSIEIFGKPSEKSQKLITISAQFPDLSRYDDLTTEQKVALAGHVDTICREVIALFRRT